MKNNISNEELWQIIGFLKVAPSRLKTLKAVENDYLIPSEISKKTELNPSQVSTSLKDLKKNNLVICMNEKSKKGKIYHATEFGIKVLGMLDSDEK